MWTLFAKELKPDHYWHTSPNENIVRLYGAGEICEVEFTEDTEGTHYGWIEEGDRDYPTMIYPHESLFSMCFPYGYKILEEKGEGRHVRLTAKLLRKIA